MVDDTIERTVGVCSFTEKQWHEFARAVHLARSKELSMSVTCLECPHSFSADDENGKSFLYCHWHRKRVKDNERCYMLDEMEFFPERIDREESE